MASNGYNVTIVDKLLRKQNTKQKIKELNPETKDKYVVFNYYKPLEYILGNILNRHGYKVAYRTKNNLKRQLVNKSKLIDKFDSSGVYQITCRDCPKMYIGQTGRSFNKRFREHIPSAKQITNTTRIESKFTEHLIQNDHGYSNINDALKILHRCKKGKLMNALEQFEIYKNYKIDSSILLNEKLHFESNALYDTVLTKIDISLPLPSINSVRARTLSSTDDS